MFESLKDKVSWRLVRAHVCTLAVALSINNTMRLPRDALRYGGLSYLFILTFLTIVVALPLVLLQLCIGQLSQQDAVGVWKAVPFFKGVGYLKILTSFVQSIYTTVYTAIATAYFMNILRSSIPFWECSELHMTTEAIVNYYNASSCISTTFMAPVREQPEYFIVNGIIIVLLWIICSFLIYSPEKFIRWILFVSGPFILIVAIAALAYIGESPNLSQLRNKDDWKHFTEPYIWFGALIQSLMSAQIVNGYLVTAAHQLYSTTNIQWTAIAFVVANVLAGWASVLFWIGIGSDYDKDNNNMSVFAIIVAAYEVANKKDMPDAWPLLIYTILIISGVTSVVTFLYPILDRVREMYGDRWRRYMIAISIIGAISAIAVLAGRHSALFITDEVVGPILIAVATLLEIIGFVLIYGWAALMDDVDFLTGDRLVIYWIIAWCGAGLIILPLFVWWTISTYLEPLEWSLHSRELWTTVTLLIAISIFISFAVYIITRQVQYDVFSKIKSSFNPSRHWGPRDPITHYHWLARRDEIQRSNTSQFISPSTYSVWQLGQMSGAHNIIHIASVIDKLGASDWSDVKKDIKCRANSDDWLYTRFRKKYKEAAFYLRFHGRQRSRSLDWFSGELSPNVHHPPSTDNMKSGSVYPEINSNIFTVTLNKKMVPPSQISENKPIHVDTVGVSFSKTTIIKDIKSNQELKKSNESLEGITNL